jgi:hypothetical protein
MVGGSTAAGYGFATLVCNAPNRSCANSDDQQSGLIGGLAFGLIFWGTIELVLHLTDEHSGYSSYSSSDYTASSSGGDTSGSTYSSSGSSGGGGDDGYSGGGGDDGDGHGDISPSTDEANALGGGGALRPDLPRGNALEVVGVFANGDCDGIASRLPSLCETHGCQTILNDSLNVTDCPDCIAYVMKDPSKCGTQVCVAILKESPGLCPDGDDDCKGLAAENSGLCGSDTCRAVVSRSAALCPH